MKKGQKNIKGKGGWEKKVHGSVLDVVLLRHSRRDSQARDRPVRPCEDSKRKVWVTGKDG